jgi:hypothetical protein
MESGWATRITHLSTLYSGGESGFGLLTDHPGPRQFGFRKHFPDTPQAILPERIALALCGTCPS